MLRKIFCILSSIWLVQSQITFIETDFTVDPNMACQIINGYHAGKPGLYRVEIKDPNTGLIWSHEPRSTLSYSHPLANPGASARRRRESCGTSYCRSLLTGGPIPAAQAPRVRYPVPGIPRTPNTPYGFGWDYLDLVHGGIAGPPFRLECDEYPYASTYEGGGIGAAGAVINCIYREENGRHGNMIGQFMNGMADGSQLGMVVTNFPFVLVRNPQAIGTPAFQMDCPLAAWTFYPMPNDPRVATMDYVSWVV